jgi:type I restriction enzyme M protein
MLTDTILKSKVDSLWDKFFSGGIANPLTAIEQMSYLIFLKRLEDMDNSRKRIAQRRKNDFESVFSGKISDLSKSVIEKCRWSYWSQLPGEEMLSFVRDVVFKFLRSLGSETSSFTQYMQDAVFIIPKSSLLQEAVKIIDDMHISEQNADVQGDLYEYLLKYLTTSGRNGQFRTPRHIIRLMVNLLDPQIGERICDPTAGTAGFLCNSYEHILESNTSKEIIEYDKEGKAHHLIGDKITDKKLMDFLKSKALTGYDFDTTMTRIGTMNLMLHGIDNPNFRYNDTLSKSFCEKEIYDIVLTNPPFKGSIDKSDINERFKTNTTKTELLFIELIYDLLVTGGRAGVIVPDGILFGSSNAHKEIRKILLEKCSLDAVISMPSGVFKPYAGVSTAVLIFRKGGITENVWFYDMQADGFSLDDKRDKIDQNDIPDIIEKFKTRIVPPLKSLSREPGKIPSREGVGGVSNSRKSKSFLVPFNEIKENNYDLSINKYKEIEYDEVKYEKPEDIINKINKLEKEILKGISELEKNK